MQKGLKVRISEYRFLEDLDDFSFLFEFYGPGFVYKHTFLWFDDNIYKIIRPPYSVPSCFGSLIIDDYDTLSNIAQQLGFYRKRFEGDLYKAFLRKPGF